MPRPRRKRIATFTLRPQRRHSRLARTTPLAFDRSASVGDALHLAIAAEHGATGAGVGRVAVRRRAEHRPSL